MDKEDNNQDSALAIGPPETELFLQWGKRKRLRCVRIRSSSGITHLQTHFSPPPNSDHPSFTTRIGRKISSRLVPVSHPEKHLPFSQPPSSRLTRNSEMTGAGAALRSESNHRGSPEKEERSYTTRGSVSIRGSSEENGGKIHQADGNQGGDENTIHSTVMNNSSRGGGGGGIVWPKLYITLSSKEKEEDFMAMKGCKLPQRPKKRAKVIQRTLLLVSPGAWLSDMSLERYEVREKKASKKRPRGLKAMGSCDSDSE